MFDPDSRYARLPTATLTTPDGREITYVRRRFVPPSGALVLLVEATVQDGDRLDRLTARTLGNPTHSWRVCDANDAMHPDDVLGEPGSKVRVPVPQAG